MGRAIKPLAGSAEVEGAQFWDVGGTRPDSELLIKTLRAALDDARAAKAAKAAFLASVSHELRTPLNAVLGFAEMISKEQFGSIDPRYADCARSIERGARRLHDILSDILDMARLEGGRIEIVRANVSLGEVVDEVLAVLRERHEGEQARVDVRVDPVLPALWTDRGRLRQILINLISNALSFTPSNGLVSVYGHFAPSGDIEIVVADSGNGMTPVEMKRAVTRFGHAEHEMARKHQGIGLGLPLAKALTEVLGGRLRIDSSKGEGTVVTLDFPLNAVSAPDSENAKANNMSARIRELLSN